MWAQGLDPYELREVVVALDIFKTEMSVARAPSSIPKEQSKTCHPTYSAVHVRSF